MSKRNALLDWASQFFNGLTGGKKADVAEGVERKTKTLYESHGSKSDDDTSSKKKGTTQSTRRLPDDDPWARYQ